MALSDQMVTKCVFCSNKEMCRHLTVDNDDILDQLAMRKFDVAVVDILYSIRCVCLIPHRLQIPWISLSLAGSASYMMRVPWLSSIAPPDVISLLPMSHQLTFVDRSQNTFISFLSHAVAPFYLQEPPPEVLEKYRRYGYVGSLQELISKSAMWFLTADYVFDYSRPMMPNMISISGLTVQRSTGELPSDIENFINGAEKGVVLMSFGSFTSIIPNDVVDKFLTTFRQLSGYRVIWRLDNKENVELPDNVMIRQWLPQNDILAHPSVKLFITHAGHNGHAEAVYNGIPMIAFPILGDQLYNARLLENKGYGKRIEICDFTADQLLDNIHKVLGDRSYKERVMKASEIFQNQAHSAVERATFWIEHVCRFGGDHLRSAGDDLPLYSYLMLDVLAFYFIVVCVLIYLLYRLIRFFAYKLFCGSSTCKHNKNNNNNNSAASGIYTSKKNN